jgi:hypothetical protein
MEDVHGTTRHSAPGYQGYQVWHHADQAEAEVTVKVGQDQGQEKSQAIPMPRIRTNISPISWRPGLTIEALGGRGEGNKT